MMRGGLGARIGRGSESYSLSDLPRGALSSLVSALRPLWRDLFLATAATLLGAALTAGLPLLARWSIDVHMVPGRAAGLLMVIVAYAALQGVLWWAQYWQRYLTERVGQNVVALLRRRLFAHLQGLDMEFFSRTPTGELVSRLTGDINAVAEVATSGTLALLGDLMSLLLITVAMLVLDVRLALMALAMVPLVLMSTALFSRRLRAAYAAVRARTADLSAAVQENLAGMQVVQSLAREKASMDRFDQVNVYALRANMHAMLVFALFFPLMTVTGNLGTAAVLAYGGSLVARGALTLGTLVAFMSYIRSFFMPLRELSQVLSNLQSAAASLDRIHSYMSIRPSVVEPEVPYLPPNPQGTLEFRCVSFGYSDGRILEDLSFTVESGEVLAVVGPSGAGKTTLVNLLTRLYDVKEGAVLIDNVDVRRWPLNHLRRTVSVVSQEAWLFPGTVLENIAYGMPTATVDEVSDLVKRLGVASVMDSLPQGLNTEVGVSAAGRVSGGQRQAIALLLAVLRNPRILILDEATSSVDGRTEALINAGLGEALRGRTGIIIAHRLRSVGLANRIMVMDKGRVVDAGEHDQLLSRCGLYREMYESQGTPGI